jgi:hypothetical protein
MKKSILLFAAFTFYISLFTFHCFAQTPAWLWAKSATGTGIDEAFANAVDASGNIYMAGYFNSPTINFGTSTLTNVGGNDVFLVKYNSSGSVLWARSGGGNGHDAATSVAVDNSGNVYITGYYKSAEIGFGTDTLTNTDFTTNNTSDFFLVKYDPNGTVLLAKDGGGLNSEVSCSVAVSTSGDVFITGYFNSYSMLIGTTTITNANTSNYTNDIFLVKYTTGGNLLWARSVGTTSWDEAYAVAVDANGNSYITGVFNGATLTFGSTVLTNAGSIGTYDLFLAKFDISGNAVWAIRAGASEDEYALSVAVNASGNSYLAGSFSSPTITFGSTTLTQVGLEDIFIAKFDINGNAVWAKSAGGDGYDDANSVNVNSSGSIIYLAGYFCSPAIAFGTDSLHNVDPNY